MKYLGLILKNLFRNKRRTALTVFSIAVSLFIFSALVSMPTVANEILADTAASARLVTHNKAGLAYSIPYAYRQKMILVPHVSAVAAQSWFGGMLHDVNDQFPNMAVDQDQAEAVWPDWGITAEQWAQFRKLRTACLVGPDTMKRFHLHLGQQIVLKGTLYPFNVTLNIVGVLGAKAPPSIMYFRRDYLEELVEARGGQAFVDTIWARADSSADVPQVIASIDEQFANSSAETQSESEASFIGSFIKNYRMIFNLAEILGVIIVITIALVAANTSAMSIRERRGEIAVMRSMGFPAGTILSILLSESFVIGLLGGLVGCGGAFIVLHVFAARPGMGPMAAIRMPASVLVETLVAAALIGLFSAWFPARAAARMNIVEALRMVA